MSAVNFRAIAVSPNPPKLRLESTQVPSCMSAVTQLCCEVPLRPQKRQQCRFSGHKIHPLSRMSESVTRQIHVLCMCNTPGVFVGLFSLTTDKLGSTPSSLLQCEWTLPMSLPPRFSGSTCCSGSDVLPDGGFAAMQTCTATHTHRYDGAQQCPHRSSDACCSTHDLQHTKSRVTPHTLCVKALLTFCHFVLLSCSLFQAAELLFVVLELLWKSRLSSLDVSDWRNMAHTPQPLTAVFLSTSRCFVTDLLW